jgi:hypothetical protein
MYYTGGCILISQRAVHIERYVHVLPGPIASRIFSDLRMSDSIFREEILYNLTNYYLYDDRFIQVPSFKGQQHIHASVLEIRLDNEVYNARFRNIESKFAADVTRNIEELQKKLILLLYDTLPSQLERENVEYTTEEFDKWLVDIKRSSTTEDVDIKVHTARTVVDKWKMKVKRKLTSEENRSS